MEAFSNFIQLFIHSRFVTQQQSQELCSLRLVLNILKFSPVLPSQHKDVDVETFYFEV